MKSNRGITQCCLFASLAATLKVFCAERTVSESISVKRSWLLQLLSCVVGFQEHLWLECLHLLINSRRMDVARTAITVIVDRETTLRDKITFLPCIIGGLPLSRRHLLSSLSFSSPLCREHFCARAKAPRGCILDIFVSVYTRKWLTGFLPLVQSGCLHDGYTHHRRLRRHRRRRKRAFYTDQPSIYHRGNLIQYRIIGERETMDAVERNQNLFWSLSRLQNILRECVGA